MLKLINPEKRQLTLAQANQNGDTALHIAVDKGKLSVIKSLCGTTAKEAVGLLQGVDHNDNTPVHRAAKLGEKTHADFLDYVVPIIKPADSIELLLNLQGEKGSVINTAFKTNHPQFAKRCLNYLGRAIKLQSKQANNLSNNEHLIELVIRKGAYGHQIIMASFVQLNKPAEQLVLFLLLAHLAKKKHQNIEPGQREIAKLIPEIARLASETEAKITETLKAIIGEDVYQKNFPKWVDGLLLLYTGKLTKEKERSYLTMLLDVLLPFLGKDDLKQDVLSWTNSRSYTILHIAAEIGHTEAIERLAWFGQWEFVVERDKNALKNLTKAALESDYGMARDVKEATVKQLECFGLTRLDKYLQPLESKTLCLIFYSKKERARWEEELKSMEQFCSKLGITTMLKEVASAARMLNLICAAKRFTPSCLMMVLLCHGGGGRIEMEDVVIPLREVVDAMAKDFYFVPKVLIVQCCMTAAEAEKMPEDQRSEVEIHSDVAHHIQHSMTMMDKEGIDKLFARYKRPANLKLPVPQKAKEARAHNATHSAMQHSMCKSVYVVGEIADEANQAYHVGPDEDVPVEVVKSLKKKAEHAISLIGHAYQHLIENNVELCNHHCYRLHSTDSNTLSETNRDRDGYIRCGHMFEELPRHFLCLMATTTGEAERLLMASKLKERAGKKTAEGNLVDLEDLFQDVRRRIATDSAFVQIPITASTLTKRLCLKLKSEDTVPEQADD